ncbi:PWI domain-containing protein [Radiomyces spectabilis]|uniref:PWI domain-containing protein n=1 Tax=Radiomyces spectabilis TaxID=64574 RepID=UPI00221F6BFA|nr:PWI domain-containing protein [Radiomyces spectabilis]KAI8393875.1 PWI domain-containing protein [Radiomyces spectabilis]
MGDAGFFKGTSSEQDSRFSNKEKKLLKSMSFPPEFDQKVDFKKVNMDVIKPWISNRITQLLGFEDEVVIDFACGLLEEKNPDPKMMQINLTGFLEKNTQSFILELWLLLLSAQESVGGIPKVFLEQKKEELRQKKEQDAQVKARQEAVMEAIRKKKESEMQDLRESETRQRRSRFGDRPPRDRSYSRSASPPPRRGRSRSPDTRSDRRDRYRDEYSRSYREDERSRRTGRDRDDRSRRHRDRSSTRRRRRSRSRSPGYERTRSPRRHRRHSRSRSPVQDRRRGSLREESYRREEKTVPEQKPMAPEPPKMKSRWDDDEEQDTTKV